MLQLSFAMEVSCVVTFCFFRDIKRKLSKQKYELLTHNFFLGQSAHKADEKYFYLGLCQRHGNCVTFGEINL